MNITMTEVLDYGSDIFKNGAVISIAYIIVLLIIRSVLKKFVLNWATSKIKLRDQSQETLMNFINNILRVLIDIVVFSLILMEFNALESLGTLVVGASSAVAVVVGFAAQESTANLVGGFFLTLFQPIKIGDFIRIDDNGVVGTVVDITIRHTVIRTLSNTSIVVPNSTMNSAVVENYNDVDDYTCLLTYGVAYGSDYDRAKDILRELANNHPLAINKEVIDVIVIKLNDYSVDLRVKVQTKDFADGFKLKTDLNALVLEKFAEADISIPFPTRTVINQNEG